MDIFLKLLIAHIVTDFFIQPTVWVADKKKKKGKSIYLYLHVILTGLVAWLFLWDWDLWYVALCIAITHLLIDLYKIICCPDNLSSFVYDQVFHILILGIAAVYLSEGADQVRDYMSMKWFDTKSLSILVGYLGVTTPAGYLVGKATERWRQEIRSSAQERNSLKDAGIWIGILERVLVLTFVIFNQFQAIGFLIAAKSILRFSDRSEDNPRKQTEYVLIGTLISFAIALFVGILVRDLNM